MNIVELDNYNLADAVRFHDRLNHRLWDRSEHLHPEVKDRLMAVARDFAEFLGIPDLDIRDITISGSNAAYNYTENSDIDLHLVVEIPRVKHDEVYRELFNAKKYQYNDEHDIRIGGADVELYAQPSDQPHHSQGIYSLLRNAWVSVPRRHRAKIDDSSVRAKYEDLVHRIDDAVNSDNYQRIANLQRKIKTMRQVGLEQQGEFGVDNIVFKLLRVNGFIKKLIDARNRARDRELSLNERRKKSKKRVRYGFGGYWYPGFGFGDSGEGGGGDGGGGESRAMESPDGVSPSTRMFLSEEPVENVVQQFIRDTAQRLGIERLPKVHLHNNADWSQDNHSFGKYEPETNDLHVNLHGRHLFDILRTTAHELAHCRQHEIEPLSMDAGNTGSDFENEAHAVAGIIMRDFADAHPGLFENASGYIPKNRREAALPQYAMALSVDIKPGQVGREANKLGLKTGRNGEPGLLMKSVNLREGRMPQPSQGSGAYRDLNEPLGPETPPTMPAGTVRVDVSDTYDWYKLGQHISNMKGLGRHDFGKGPPSTIFSFGDEETEHKFIQDLAATGLDVTDIDPKDPKQPPGTRRIKTDPTYNVAEAGGSQYKEIEFVCANPQFPDATDPELQQQMYVGLTKIPGVIPLWQDQSDYSAGQASLTAIYKDRASRQQIMKLAKQLGVKIDLEQPVSDSYVDRAIRGEHEGQRGMTEADAARTAKSAIDQTEVFGVRGYRARCLEPGCEWHSRSYDRIKQAQDSAKKHAAAHIKPGVTEGSGQDSFVQRLGRKLQQSGYTQTGPGTWSQGPDGRYVNITPLPDGQYGWELRRVNRRGKWYSGVDTAKAVVAIFKEFDIFSKHPVDESLAEQNELVESLRQEFELLEDEFIGEIKMSPTNLRAEAAQTGAIAGMEFEMIVPGVESDDPEMEPDYGSDERCRSIDDAVQFFHDGDYNGRREVARLRDRMQEDFEEWLYEKIDEDWANNPEEYIYQYLVRDVDASTIGEIIGVDLSDADGATKQQVAQAAEIVNDNEQQPYYDDARDWHREEYQDAWDESDWLDSQDLDTMSAIENAYEITWPHWTYNNESAVDIDSVAADFSEAVGMPVNTSQRYHGATREAGKYVIEPDGSLRGDSEDDMGLEFVSPPMPIDKMLDQLKKVREWAGRNGCYTNRSTGLHINISVPEFSNDKLDYVKLALLLGDKYVLDQFGRSTNTYTKSALGIVQDRVRAMPKTAQALLDRMRGHMDDLATKAIHSGETDKFTSINTKEGYIEFRSPGGDWLDENFDKVENTLLRFTVALKAAMDPEAYREEYLKKLYKLLEPTAEDQKGSDTVRYFADYVAGKIPATALRSFVKQAQLQRRIAKEPASGKQYWWRVYKDGRDARNTAMIEVVASSEQEARDKAAAEFGIFSSEYKAYMDAVALRPYVETEPEYEIFQVAGNRVVQTFRAADNDAALAYFDRTISAGDRPYYDVRRAGTGTAQPAAQQPAGGFEFERSQTDIENRLGWPDQTGDANYEVVNRNTLQPVYLFIANTDQDAARKYREIIDAMGMPGAAENYGYRARGSVMPPVDRQGTQSGSQRPAEGGNFTGNWLILDPQGREIHRFSGVGNVQSDANRVAMQWMRSRPGTMQAGVTVVPEMN